MSSPIDKRIVEMNFNNSQFEKGVGQSLSTIDKLKNSLNFKNSEVSLSNFQNALGKLNFSAVSNAAELIQNKFTLMGRIVENTLERLATKAVDVGERMIKSLSVDNISVGLDKFWNKTQSVGTLISQGYELDTVNEQLERLNWFTDETSYNFTDMVSNISKFTATGQDLETSVDAMQGIALWAALSGQNAGTASRAMYQLSQAMGAGVMRLEDYKSIQNASMDTDEFRQKALDAAVALGTLRQNVDGTYTSLVGDTPDFSKAQFATSLTKGMWFTSDVMMKVFNDYSSAVDELYTYSSANDITASEAIEELGDNVDAFGLKAFKAGQEARTFNDVIDSVKDAVSTGWMNTFENVFGNYEEAKTLWTDLANELYDVFAEGGNQRNALLAEWKELGGRESIITAFWNVFHGLVGVIDAVKEGFRKVFPEVTARQLVDWTKKVEKLTEKFGNVTRVVETVIIGMDGLKHKGSDVAASINGIEKVTEDFTEPFAKIRDIAEGLAYAVDIVLQVLKAFGRTVKPLISEVFGLVSPIVGLTGDFKSFFKTLSTNLKSTDAIYKWMQNIVDAITGVIQKIKYVTTTVADFFGIDLHITLWEAIVAVFNKLKDAAIKVKNAISMIAGFLGIDLHLPTWKEAIETADSIKNVILRIQDAVSKMKTAIKSVAAFFGIDLHVPTWEEVGEAITSLRDTLGRVKDGFVAAYEAIRNFLTQEGIHDFLERLKEKLYVVRNALVTAKEAVKSFFKSFAEKDDADEVLNWFEKFQNVITKVWNTIKPIIDKLWALLTVFVQSIFGSLSDLSFDDIMDIGKIGVEAFIGVKIGALASKIKGLQDLLSPITSIIDGLIGKFKGAEDANASMLEFAKGIGIIAASLVVLSLIDADKLTVSVLALAGMMEMMATALKQLSGSFISDTFTDFMEDENVTSKTTEKFTTNLKGADRVIRNFAIGIAILSGSLALISSMDTDKMVVGLAALAGMMEMLVIFVKQFTKIVEQAAAYGVNLKKMSKSLTILATAILILTAVVAILGNMDLGTLAEGILALGAVLVELWGFMKLMQKVDGVGAAAASVLVIANGLLIISAAVAILGALSLQNLIEGIVAMAAVLAELWAFAALMSKIESPGQMLVAAAYVLVMSSALLILSGALAIMGTLSWDSMLVGITAIGLAMMEFWAFAELIAMVNAGTILLASVYMLAMSAAMVVLAAAIGAMSLLSWEALLKSLAIMAVELGVMAAAALLLSPAIVPMLGMAAAIALVATAFLAIAAAMTAVVALIPIFVGGLVGGIAVLLGGIVAFIKGLTEIITVIIEGLAIIVYAICEALVQSFPEVLKTIGVLLISLLDFLIEILPALTVKIVDLIAVAIDSLAEGIRRFGDRIISAVMNLISSIIELMISAFQAVIRLIPVVGNKWADGMEGWKDAVQKTLAPESGKKIGENYSEGIIDGISSKEDAGKQTGISFGTTVTEAIGGGLVSRKSGSIMGSNLVGGITEELTKSDGRSIGGTFGLDILSGLQTNLNSDTGAKASGELMTGVVNGMAFSMPQLQNAALLTGSSTLSGIEEYLNENQGEEIADNVTKGFVKGVKKNLPSVVSAARELGKGAGGATASVLAIESPSKVFEEMGMYVDLGFINGLIKYRNRVYDESAGIATDVVSTFSDPLSNFADIIGEDMDEVPIITPVLDLSEVRKGVNVLDGMLSYNKAVAIGNSGSITKSVHDADTMSELAKLRQEMSGLRISQEQANSMTDAQLIRAVREGLSQVGVYLDRRVIGKVMENELRTSARAGGVR